MALDLARVPQIGPGATSGPAPGLTPFLLFNVFAYGAKGDGVTDDSAAIQRALNAAVTAGSGMVWFPGGYTYLLSSATIQLARATSNWICLWGYGATIKLSAGAPRFLDFNKVADYDSFGYYDIRGFTVDANNVGGRHHVVIGTYINGQPQTRLSVNQLRLIDITTINVPVDPTLTNHRLNVWIVPGFGTADTQGTVANIWIERVRFSGGNMGCVLGAQRTGSASSDFANCLIDNITIDGFWHSLGSVQTAFFSSSNMQIGADGVGGRCVLRNCYGQYSGDVGLEIDSMQYVEADDCLFVDALTANYYVTSFSSSANPNGQILRFTNCKAQRLLVVPTTNPAVGGGNVFGVYRPGLGWWIVHPGTQTWPAVDINQVWLHNCSYYRNAADCLLYGEALLLQGGRNVKVTGFSAVVEGINYAGAGNVNPCMIVSQIQPGLTQDLILKDCQVKVIGQRTGSGIITYNLLSIQSVNYGTGASVTVTETGGALNAPTIVSGGSGFLFGAQASVSGGGGSGGAISLTTTNGVITGAVTTNPGSGYTSNPTVIVNSPGGATCNLTIDGFKISFDFSAGALTSSGFRGLVFGNNGSGILTLGGTIKDVNWTLLLGDSGPQGIHLGTTSAMTIKNQLLLDGCNFYGLTNGTPLVYDAPSQQGNIILRNRIWTALVIPAPTAIAVPSSATAWQNTLGYDVMVASEGGTVSLIEFSNDNSHWFASPATSGLFPVRAGEYLRWTYSGVPTATAIPER